MGFFSRLFGRKKAGTGSEGFMIDIRENGVVINGHQLDVPTHIDALFGVLGTPRKTVFKISDRDKEIYEKLHPGETLVQRVNYTWDGLGLMCYTNNGSVVNCFSIRLNKTNNNAASNPKCLFGGTVFINGKPWLSSVLAGEDKEVMRHVTLGGYLITAEYTDFDQDDSVRDEKSFTSLEIQLKDH